MAAAKHLLSLHILLFLTLTTQPKPSSSSDVELLLQKIKPSLQGTAENIPLLTWDTSVPLCQWSGLKWLSRNGSPLQCSDRSSPQWTNLSLYKDPSLRISSLQLPSVNLSGTIPREIGELTNLQSIYLGVNSLTGSIPLELGYSTSLTDIDFSHNLLSGSLPTSIWNLCGGGLVSLRLHGNSLTGSLPEPAVPDGLSCRNLQFLDLGKNGFAGNFPEFIVGFRGLKQLDLGDNHLSGEIPGGIAQLKLEKLNLSHNNFSGVLPTFGSNSKFGAEAFEGNNPELCGPPLKTCGGGFYGNTSGGLSPGAVAGIVIGLMAGAVIVVSLLIGYHQGKRKRRDSYGYEREEEEDLEDEESGGGGGDGRLILFQGGEHLTLEDVLNATGQVMEKTSYGTVYKAKLSDGGTIALRLLREGSCRDKGSCLAVIKQLGRIRHENLIPLRAFYQGKRGEKLLIYDYQHNKTLHDLLHESRAGKPPLLWTRRHKIALGMARGLAHLHGLEPPITHGNVRSKTTLVDDFFVPRLNEYGLDKIMVPSVADEIVSESKSDGYKAPELHRMKGSSSRTDVYSFGIVMLEMLLGKKPSGSKNSADLPSMVKAAVLEETTMEVFDVEILKGSRNNPVEEGLVQALKLAMGCCAPVASVRPTMDEVVRQLEENRPRSNNRSALYSPAETRSGSITPF